MMTRTLLIGAMVVIAGTAGAQPKSPDQILQDIISAKQDREVAILDRLDSISAQLDSLLKLQTPEPLNDSDWYSPLPSALSDEYEAMPYYIVSNYYCDTAWGYFFRLTPATYIFWQSIKKIIRDDGYWTGWLLWKDEGRPRYSMLCPSDTLYPVPAYKRGR